MHSGQLKGSSEQGFYASNCNPNKAEGPVAYCPERNAGFPVPDNPEGLTPLSNPPKLFPLLFTARPLGLTKPKLPN